MIEAALDNEIEEYPLKYINDQTIPTITIYNSKPIEIEPRKVLNINKNLTDDQEQRLVQLLRKHKEAFAWDYPDMKELIPNYACTTSIQRKMLGPFNNLNGG